MNHRTNGRPYDGLLNPVREIALIVLLITLTLFVLYLLYERIALDRLRKSIPLVITVTGTRGKSTVVRLLATILRESGRVVLAKSTGSQAQYVLPDGTIERVPRRGLVSVLEQKKALRKAVRLKTDCLVVEVMSIRPENHLVESQRILKPNIVVLTNVRKDHTEAMGDKVEEIARVLQLDFTESADVYLPQEHLYLFEPGTSRSQPSRLIPVLKSQERSLSESASDTPGSEFGENLDLVSAVARALHNGDAVIARGIQNAVHDIGRFRIWSLQVNGRSVFAVNAFAANDPVSTMKVLEKTRQILGGTGRHITGLLSLRADRPDRTTQWIDALSGGMAAEFERLYVLGGHANVVCRKVDNSSVLALKPPDVMTEVIAGTAVADGIIFGFGNISGAGQHLVEYWQREGIEYGI